MLLVMSFVIYSLIGLMPGDPIDMMMASNPGVTPEVVAQLRAIYGLDQPLLLRYGHWLVARAAGRFRLLAHPFAAGAGGAGAGAVADLQADARELRPQRRRSPSRSASCAALRPGGIADSIVSLFAFAGISVPVFWLALVLILVVRGGLHGCRPAASAPSATAASSTRSGT